MDHKQDWKQGERYRLELLQAAGDRLYINGCVVDKVRASASQQNRLYGCQIAVMKSTNGAICIMDEPRVRSPKQSEAPLMAQELLEMGYKTEKVFPWHAGMGRTIHPVIRALRKLNKAGQAYTWRAVSGTGVLVYRRLERG